jgi:hypothetical protein
VGDQLKAGDEAGVVESVKAASDIYAPLTGEVVEVNGSAGAIARKASTAIRTTMAGCTKFASPMPLRLTTCCRPEGYDAAVEAEGH